MKFEKPVSLRVSSSWVLFYFVISLFIAAELINIFASEESFEVAYILVRYLVIVTFFAGIFLFAISFLGASVYGGAIAFGLIFSLFSLKLNNFEIIIVRHAFVYLALFVITYIVLAYILIQKIKRDELPSLSLYVVLSAILSIPVFLNYLNGEKSESLEKNELNFTEYKKITLRDKPNIYMLSYDSLIPSAIAKKNINLQNVPYEKNSKDFLRIFPNSLTFDVPSVPSLNSIMRLNQQAQSQNYNLFAGRQPSILEQIMHANGYEVVTGFISYYFGKKGRYVDQFLVDLRVEKTTLCIEPWNSFRMEMRGYFFCRIHEYVRKNAPAIYPVVFDKIAPGNDNSWHEELIRHIKNVSSKKIPTLSFIYTFKPLGHVPLDYDNKNEKDKNAYKKHFLEEAESFNELLIRIRENILQFDPDAIVVFFGDHGAYLSRQANKESNPEFYYTDRHRILMGILKTQNTCANPEQRFVNDLYATPSRLILDIIDCLSSNGVPEDIISFDEDRSILKYVTLESQ